MSKNTEQQKFDSQKAIQQEIARRQEEEARMQKPKKHEMPLVTRVDGKPIYREEV